MCRFAAVVALVLAAAGSASGQSARAALMRRQGVALDSIVANLKRAESRLAVLEDSVRGSHAQLDTIRAGALRILVGRNARDRVANLAPRAFAAADSVAGNASARLVNHWLFVRVRGDSAEVVEVGAVGANGRETLYTWGTLSDTLLVRWISNAAVRQLDTELRNPVRRWLGSEMNPDTAQTRVWATARLELVSSLSTVSRSCYRGDIQACKLALRLSPTADPATEWFDVDMRRTFVRESSMRRYAGPSALEQSCIGGSDKACLFVLRATPWGDWRGPVNDFPATRLVRSTVARLAVQLGGRDGYERLIRSTGDPGQALAEAAGVPLDSLVRVWQSRIHSTRLPSADVSLGIATGSIAWILFCGALSLKSSRWR